MVIVGHTIDGPLRGIIFSFHMPLFFIVSGATYKYTSCFRERLSKVRKSFKKLIVPAVVCFLVRSYMLHGIVSIRELLVSIIWGSGVDGSDFSAVGMVWFLYVMFEVRLLADIIHNYFKHNDLIVAVFFSLLGISIAKWHWLPFSIDIALAVLVFFFGGRILNNMHGISDKKYILLLKFGLIWAISFLFTIKVFHDNLELASRSYPMFGIIPYITAFAGTIAICIIAIIMEESCEIIKKIYNILCDFGKNSLTIFFIHYFDVILKPLWGSFGNSIIHTICRVTCDIVIYFIFQFVKTKKLKVNCK